MARMQNHLYDQHHILYQKRFWEHGILRLLREYWYCKVNIDRNTIHKAIHLGVLTVPAPRGPNARMALDQLYVLEDKGAIHYDDPIEKRLEVLAAIFDCIEQPTADALREQKRIVCNFHDEPSP